MLKLDNIKPAKGSTKNRKRVGRGNSSGSGTYSGKGQKGQRSRSGASGLKRLGMKKQLLQIPKLRGFKSHKPKNQSVNLLDLNSIFKDGDTINPQKLVKKGLIKDSNLPAKILGKGDFSLKDLKIEGIKVSETARKQIEENNGKIS